jgi:hypothetical protein
VTAKKEKRKTEQVCDCNNLACVIATRGDVRLQKKNLTLSVWLKKETRLFEILLQAWVANDYKKLKCVIAKTAGLFL